MADHLTKISKIEVSKDYIWGYKKYSRILCKIWNKKDLWKFFCKNAFLSCKKIM